MDEEAAELRREADRLRGLLAVVVVNLYDAADQETIEGLARVGYDLAWARDRMAEGVSGE